MKQTLRFQFHKKIKLYSSFSRLKGLCLEIFDTLFPKTTPSRPHIKCKNVFEIFFLFAKIFGVRLVVNARFSNSAIEYLHKNEKICAKKYTATLPTRQLELYNGFAFFAAYTNSFGTILHIQMCTKVAVQCL